LSEEVTLKLLLSKGKGKSRYRKCISGGENSMCSVLNRKGSHLSEELREDQLAGARE
jgi:hypothetical protein